ncbi:Ppx/GppA phosphatase family protein [Sulfurovum sp. NBC37-1]|uniref:Ppx/GppA phosphatase family protein n=1 Tax=Sulfurovum sp. (strain NBC37-1) TaxID=387093 RepID=UPI0001587D75|nr:Ppx/GppA phosphatase family protein [Sulfurovum sp. NBC37-1]BAF72928.1 guanosine pentaphosphate phosphohydrolase [Sulfurovum sp. NBC37-1]
MAKRTAIIDIGSNSARLVIFEKSSHYGFHLICEQKSKVRIGEGAYEKEGYLQPVGIERAFLALQSFIYTLNKYQVHKTICVATSALRDAPNGKLFVKWIKKELGLTIRIIDGKQEARFGAIAANNLLPFNDAITIDIGGGSSDMALIQNGHIVDTYSLDLGTVRLKELFFDKECSVKESNMRAKAFIHQALESVPETFRHTLAVGIGGTARTLSKGIMRRSEHPLDKLHAFTYEVEAWRDYFEAIPQSSAKGLRKFNLKKSRYDTIREGTLIFNEILSHIGAKKVISSAVGVREGVFLKQMLKDEGLSFPKDINPSVISILDRFHPLIKLERKNRGKLKIASKLYRVMQAEINDSEQYKNELHWALKLSYIGELLNVYNSHETAFYIAIQELNYGFTHEEMILISSLLRMHGRELLYQPLVDEYSSILPKKKALLWLSFIYTLTVFLHENSHSAQIDFSYEDKTLTITSDQPLYLAKEKIKKLEKPVPFAIIIKDRNKIPKNKALGV